jgi:hypothetical protein
MFNLISVLFILSVWSFPQASHKPSWQTKDTNCNENMTLCWYGAEQVSDPEVIAYGQRWNTLDKEEKPLEWVTEVRCLREKHMCILARNQHVLGITRTNIDLYQIQEWSELQIRAVEESDFPKGEECEIDTLMLNRSDGSVSLLAVPGPASSSKRCMNVMKPKTVMYTLDLKSLWADPGGHQ